MGEIAAVRASRKAIRGCRRRGFAAVALVIAASMGAATARAECSGVSIGSFSSNPVAWRGSSTGYDPLDAANYAQPVNFTLSNNGGACTVIVGVTTGDADSGLNRSLSSGAGNLAFNLYTDSLLRNIFRNPPNASASQVLVYTFAPSPARQSTTLTFYFNVPPQQLSGTGVLVPTGSYGRMLTFSAYDGTLANPGPPVSLTNVNFAAAVQADMQVSVVPAGQAFDPGSTSQTVMLQTVDLQTAASSGLDLWVRANTGFNLQLTSQNRGVMRYSANPSDRSAVPYTLALRVNGSYVPVDLRNTVTLSAATGPTGLGGIDYPISVSVNSLSNAASFPVTEKLPLAGHYGDVITVTGIAQ